MLRYGVNIRYEIVVLFTITFQCNPTSVKNKIEMMLRLELGKSRRLREWSAVSRISEAIRCINLLNENSCLKLLISMEQDILLRSSYIQYLVTSKQALLFSDTYLNR